LFYIAVIADE